jgi:hypothetical protein
VQTGVFFFIHRSGAQDGLFHPPSAVVFVLKLSLFYILILKQPNNQVSSFHSVGNPALF